MAPAMTHVYLCALMDVLLYSDVAMVSPSGTVVAVRMDVVLSCVPGPQKSCVIDCCPLHRLLCLEHGLCMFGSLAGPGFVLSRVERRLTKIMAIGIATT